MGRKVPCRAFELITLLVFSAAGASAACTGTTSIVCTGGPAAHVQYDRSDNTPTPTAASTYPATITVPSTFTAGVTAVTIKLNGYVAVANLSGTPQGNTETSSTRMGLLLVHGSKNLEIMNSIGAPQSTGQNIPVLTVQDGASNGLMPSGLQGCVNWNQTTSIAYEPTSNFNSFTLGSNVYPSPAPAIQSAAEGHNHTDCSTLIHTATPNTLAGVFTGVTAAGDWSLYLVDNDAAADVQFTSWELDLTVSASATGTTTTLSANPTTAFTSGANSTVVLTATVTGTSGPTGNVTFKDGTTTLTCTGGNPAALSSGQATCSTTFTGEGIHTPSANYNGDTNNLTSSGAANIFLQNHATNTGTTYCNTGPILNNGSSNGGYFNTVPYPSVIFVGDGVNTDITNSVNNLSVQLKNFASVSGTTDMHMLLVAPDGTHAFDFWGNAGSTLSGGNYTLIDGSTQLPSGGAISAGSYAATSYFNTDVFTPGPPAPAPQPPSSFSFAPPAGSSSFETAFVGAAAHGAWSLFLYNASGSGDTTDLNGGWCLDITPATGHATTVTVTSNPTQAVKGNSVTFQATVASSPSVGNTGTVTFTENGSPLVGAPNSGVANVVAGVATIATSSLPEGDHTISALYHDSTNTFSDNFGTVTMRVDAATSTPTLSSNIWSYCNPTGITIPLGTVFVNDIGAAGPNPSNIFVTNLPGTINTVGLTLNGFHVTSPGNLESLLVGPNGASAPTSAQTLDFFSFAGGTGGSTAFGPQNTSFLDGFAAAPINSAPVAQNGPASYGATSYFSSPFFTLPGTVQHATTQGAFTFNTGTYSGSGGGVYKNTLPNGTWSLYFDQNIHHSGDGASSWCVNFVENPVTLNVTKSHTGSAPSNHFKQGEQGAQFNISILNNGDSNGKGSTGDPDGLHPLVVVDTLAADFAPVSLPTGTPWNCAAVGQTVTCKSDSVIAAGSSYPQLNIPVNVSKTAAATDNNSVSVSGGGATSVNSNTDTVTIDPAPVLSITKTHPGTFTQGQTAVWNIQVTNTAVSASGATDGTTVTVTDTLPTGYTFASFTGTGWLCAGVNTVTCTTSAVVAGGNTNFNLIALTVNVPTNSPTSVSNTATVFGGGDVNHTSLGTAASGSDNGVTVVQVPATITTNVNTTPQSALINTNFGVGLSVTVKDAGLVVIQGESVTFLAPASGASGTFTNTTDTVTVTTDVNGVATGGVFKANGTAGGPYSVTATASTGSAGPGTFSLTNTSPDLTVSKTHSPSTFSANDVGDMVNITVSNGGSAATSGTVTVTDTLPAGLTFSSSPTVGWSCGVGGSNPVVCTNTTAIASGGGISSLVLNVNVAASTGSPLTNNVSVACSCAESVTSNNSNTDSIPVTQTQGTTTVAANATALFSASNQSVSLSATVSTSPGTVNTGTVTFTVKNGGTTIGVPVNSGTVTAGAASANFTLPGGTAPGSYTIQAVYNPGAAFTTSNDSTHTLTVTAPDLTVAKTHSPSSFTVNDVGDMVDITVSNGGSAATSGTVTVTDTLPTGLTFASSLSGGWVCNAGGSNPVVCTSTSVIASGGGMSSLVLNVNVAASTGSPLINNVSVACTCAENVTNNNSNTDSIPVVQSKGTTTVAVNATAPFSASNQSVTLSATVSTSPGTVNTGTVTFTVLNGATPIGVPVGSGTVTGGAASASFTLPGGTAASVYTIQAVYNPGAGFTTSSDSTHTLTVTGSTTSPAVVSYSVLWGSQSYNVVGSPRNRLPWQITGIRVVFSEAITAGTVNSLSGAGITTTGFTGLGTNTLTWIISPLSIGNFATMLAGSGMNALQDAGGNGLAAGAGFSQNLKILYGDLNDDGLVNAQDLVLVNGARTSAYNILADMNGDGVVNAADVQIVRLQVGTSLP